MSSEGCCRESGQQMQSSGKECELRGVWGPWGPLGRATSEGQVEKDTWEPGTEVRARPRLKLRPGGGARRCLQSSSGRVACPELPAVESKGSSAGGFGWPWGENRRKHCQMRARCKNQAENQTSTAPGGFALASPWWKGQPGLMPETPPHDGARRGPPGSQCSHLLQ